MLDPPRLAVGWGAVRYSWWCGGEGAWCVDVHQMCQPLQSVLPYGYLAGVQVVLFTASLLVDWSSYG